MRRLDEKHSDEKPQMKSSPARRDSVTTSLSESALSASQSCAVSLNVLVVDDDVSAADSVARHLEMYGHKTRKVRAGRAVLEAARRFLPDVILLDTASISGSQAAALVRRERQFDHTLLVALTDWERNAHGRTAWNDGADFHFTKPVANSVLMEVLAKITPQKGERPGVTNWPPQLLPS